MSKVITMADECSGTTVLDDGTRVYWTEGRSSDIVVRYPDGRTETLPVCEPNPLLDAMMELDASGHAEYQDATDADQAEWEAARNG